MQFRGGTADQRAGREVRGFEVPARGGHDVREARWVGHGEAEAFFYDAGEVGEGLDVLPVGGVGEELFAEDLVPSLC